MVCTPLIRVKTKEGRSCCSDSSSWTLDPGPLTLNLPSYASIFDIFSPPAEGKPENKKKK
jgi:hypothetical protein